MQSNPTHIIVLYQYLLTLTILMVMQFCRMGKSKLMTWQFAYILTRLGAHFGRIFAPTPCMLGHLLQWGDLCMLWPACFDELLCWASAELLVLLVNAHNILLMFMAHSRLPNGCAYMRLLLLSDNQLGSHVCTPSHQSRVWIHECQGKWPFIMHWHHVFTLLLSWWILTGKICKYGSESPFFSLRAAQAP